MMAAAYKEIEVETRTTETRHEIEKETASVNDQDPNAQEALSTLQEIFPLKTKERLIAVLKSLSSKSNNLVNQAVEILMSRAEQDEESNGPGGKTGNDTQLRNGGHSASASPVRKRTKRTPAADSDSAHNPIILDLTQEDETYLTVTDEITTQRNAQIVEQEHRTSDLPVETPGTSGGQLSPEEIFGVIKQLQQRFPDIDPDRAYNRLEKCQNLEAGVVEYAAELEDPVLPQTPEVAQMSSNSLNDSMDEDFDPNIPGPSGMQRNNEVSQGGGGALLGFLSEEEREGLERVVDMFPAVDPRWVVESLARDGKSAQDLVDYMTHNSGFPKLKDRLERAKREKRRRGFFNEKKFQPKDFLRIFPKPYEYFMDTERTVSAAYKNHSIVCIFNDYPDMAKKYLDDALESAKYHYYPTFRRIQEERLNDGPMIGKVISGEMPKAPGNRRGIPKKRAAGAWKKKAYNRTNRNVMPWPDLLDEGFFRELQFLKFEQKITDFERDYNQHRKARMETARKENKLEECECCFLDDILPEDMIKCSYTIHKFCTPCVTQHAQVQIGDEGRSGVKCMEDGCEGEFGVRSIQELLKPNLVNLMLRRSQQDELRKAKIDNMESCPACDFVLIIDNPQEKIFKCQNPDCLKETCRANNLKKWFSECKEESHIPLRCDEVEKSVEVAMRKYIEERMAEAMIRVCPKCSKRIIKQEGCNKMTCPCGAYICYVCGVLLSTTNPYSHFSDMGGKKNGCPATSSLKKLHEDVAEKAGREAKEKYLKDNPQMRNMKDVDVKKLVSATPPRGRGRRGGRGGLARGAVRNHVGYQFQYTHAGQGRGFVANPNMGQPFPFPQIPQGPHIPQFQAYQQGRGLHGMGMRGAFNMMVGGMNGWFNVQPPVPLLPPVVDLANDDNQQGGPAAQGGDAYEDADDDYVSDEDEDYDDEELTEDEDAEEWVGPEWMARGADDFINDEQEDSNALDSSDSD